MDLLSFYNANKFEDTATYNVVISDRITDENGDPFGFTVKPKTYSSTKSLLNKIGSGNNSLFSNTYTNLSLDDYTVGTLESIANNTSDISNSLKSLNDEVKYISDIAEQKYISNYNNSVRGDTTNQFFIPKATDPQEILEIVKKAMSDDIVTKANGVYS